MRGVLGEILADMAPSGVSIEVHETSDASGWTPYFGFDHDPNAVGFDTVGTGGQLSTQSIYPVLAALPAYPTAGLQWVLSSHGLFLAALVGDTDEITESAWDVEAGTQPADFAELDAFPTYARRGGTVDRGAVSFVAASTQNVDADNGGGGWLPKVWTTSRSTGAGSVVPAHRASTRSSRNTKTLRRVVRRARLHGGRADFRSSSRRQRSCLERQGHGRITSSPCVAATAGSSSTSTASS